MFHYNSVISKYVLSVKVNIVADIIPSVIILFKIASASISITWDRAGGQEVINNSTET